MPEARISHITIPRHLPLIALKNTVLFSKVVIPLIVQRPKSIAAMEQALSGDRMALFVTQKKLFGGGGAGCFHGIHGDL